MHMLQQNEPLHPDPVMPVSKQARHQLLLLSDLMHIPQQNEPLHPDPVMLGSGQA